MFRWMRPFFNGKENHNRPPYNNVPFHFDDAPFHWDSPPFHYDAPITTMVISTGQSNSDEGATQGVAVGWMTNSGFDNPAYSESSHPGQPFRQWYSNGQFGKYSTDGIDNPETPVSVTGSQTGGTASLISAAAGLATFDVTSHVVVAGANESAYNGIHRITFDDDDDEIRYTVPSGTTSPATGTITVRHAGWKEVLKDDIETITNAGGYVYLAGMIFMQGEGNADYGAPASEFDNFADFLQETYDYITTTAEGWTNVIVNPNFTIAVGLTVLKDASNTDPHNLAYVRSAQKRACRKKSFAHFCENVQLTRADGTHCDPSELFPIQFEAIQKRRNIPQDNEFEEV